MSDIFRGILREFEQDKVAAQRKLAARYVLLYEKLPRVEEIDKKLLSISMSLAQIVLDRGDNKDKRQLLKAESEQLVKEKSQLLHEYGYDDDFFEDIFKCQICKDTGFDQGKQCNCLKQRLIAKYFEMSNLGKVGDYDNFDSFNLSYYSDMVHPNHGISPRANMEKIFTVALDFVEDFGTNFENLLLYGATGLGKTFLSNCIARELLEKGHTVLYTSSSQLFRHVEDLRFGRNMEQLNSSAILNTAYEADLLIIDDLGTEFSTTVTNAELFNFINTRLLKKKPTIISTNLNPNELEKAYTDRITSRIFGEYVMLHFFGDDIRIGKKHGLMQ